MSVSRCRSARSTTHGATVPSSRVCRRDLGERDLHLVQRLRPALVGPRRLRGRADELPGEQVGQRRMTLPVGEQRDQQVGPAQQRRLGRGPAADGDVVAAAGAAVAAVDGERLGAEPALPGLLVQRGGDRDLLVPAGQRLDVDLDDAGVGGDRQGLQPRVVRRAVALQHHRRRRCRGGRVRQPPTSSTHGSSSSTGGRNTYSSPSRTSATSAVGRRAVGGDDDGPRLRRPAATGSGGLAASGSGSRLRFRRLPGDRVQRQPQAGGRITGQQHDAARGAAASRRCPSRRSAALAGAGSSVRPPVPAPERPAGAAAARRRSAR